MIKNHSYSNYQEVKLNHISLNLTANFNKKILSGSVVLSIENLKETSYLILDSRQLNIQTVLVDSVTVDFIVGKEDPIFGSSLTIPILKNTKKVSIQYATTPSSAALQWLSPAQTNDKTDPFLFSQSQAILARTWIPLMDCPAVRFTYDATITVPNNLLPLMSAINPTVKNNAGVYTFTQPKPIPSYLMAIAIGNVEFKNVGRNSGVYAEPGMLPKAFAEFNEMQQMIDEAEKLYGTYVWNRYDVLVLPPSFPFGGMENPELTFATPTIIAGDKSLVSLVAHELAHSWSGNLVTNETWEDFWLNEGFTVYFEQRIMEKIYGKEYEEMLTVNGFGELQNTLKDLLKTNSADTKLFLNLEGRNPDDGVTDIAYEKGRFFLQSIEKVVGRKQWDEFLNLYFKTHAFGTMNTKKFITFIQTNLINKNAAWSNEINLNEWIYNEGLPSNCPIPTSSQFTLLNAEISAYSKTKLTTSFKAKDYTTHHWLYVLRHLPSLTSAEMAELDAAFNLTNSTNAEIQCDWYQLAITNGYDKALNATKNYLHAVGRRKFLTPLYKKFAVTEKGKIIAKEIFATAKNGYHAVANETLQNLLYE